MGTKKITSILIILVAMGAIAYFVVLKNRQAPVPLLNQMTKNETANWKTYRNENYGFEIKYPPNLEPLEGRASFYQQLEFSPFLNVCFASVNRIEFYCEAELYIAPSFVASPQNLHFSNANSFLGLPRCPNNVLLPRPKFDGVEGDRVDTCEADGLHLNAFVTNESFLYLLSTEPSVGYTTEKDAAFQGMIDSFKFIKP